jgi:hypothetical protein
LAVFVLAPSPQGRDILWPEKAADLFHFGEEVKGFHKLGTLDERFPNSDLSLFAPAVFFKSRYAGFQSPAAGLRGAIIE